MTPTFQIAEAIDFTKIPNEIEAKLTEYDSDNSVRPTIINVGQGWEKNFKKSLLAAPETVTLNVDAQSQEVYNPNPNPNLSTLQNLEPEP